MHAQQYHYIKRMHRTTLLGANLSKLGSGDWLPPGLLSLPAQHPQSYCLLGSLLAKPLQTMGLQMMDQLALRHRS